MRTPLDSSDSASWVGPWRKICSRPGFPFVVHSRSQGPVDDLVAAGAARASSPADVARRATRIITMLPDSPDVERVLEGAERRLQRAAAGHHPDRHEHHRAGDGPTARRACGVARRHDARRARQRRRDRRHQRDAVDHGRRRRDGVRGRQADARRDGQPRARHPHRRLGRRTTLQGLQSDGDRRRRSPWSARRSRWRARPASMRPRCGRRCSADSPRAACSRSTANASSTATTSRGSARRSTPRIYRIVAATLAENHSPAPVSAVVQQLVDGAHGRRARGRRLLGAGDRALRPGWRERRTGNRWVCDSMRDAGSATR